MAEVLTVQNQKMLEALQNHENGEVAFCEDEQMYMIYKNDQWMPVEAEMTGDGLQINLYDLNKQIISQLPDFEVEQWEGARKVFQDWMKFRMHSEYFMLYGREINYFTLFHSVSSNGEFDNLWDGIKECLGNIGAVRAFDITQDNSAIEVWLQYEDIITVLYLFEYDEGIVTFNGD